MNTSKTIDCILAASTIAIIVSIFTLGCNGSGIDYGKLLNSLTNSVPAISTPTTTTTTSTTTTMVVTPTTPVVPPKPVFVPNYDGYYTATMNMPDTPSFSFYYWMTPDSKTVQCEVPKSAIFTYADGTTAPAQMGGGYFWARKLPFDGPITLRIVGANVTKTYVVSDKLKDQVLKAQ